MIIIVIITIITSISLVSCIVIEDGSPYFAIQFLVSHVKVIELPPEVFYSLS